MARISKAPEVRRQELLNTAMELFARQGYEETSMSDIARAAGVAQGLCYRYFDSKQKLFQEAMAQYVRNCCDIYLPVIHDRGKTIRMRLVEIAGLISESDRHSQYSAFYHRADSRALHEKFLSIARFLLPHVTEELCAACDNGELQVRCPEGAASYLLYGLIGLLGKGERPLSQRLEEALRYAALILHAG